MSADTPGTPPSPPFPSEPPLVGDLLAAIQKLQGHMEALVTGAAVGTLSSNLEQRWDLKLLRERATEVTALRDRLEQQARQLDEVRAAAVPPAVASVISSALSPVGEALVSKLPELESRDRQLEQSLRELSERLSSVLLSASPERIQTLVDRSVDTTATAVIHPRMERELTAVREEYDRADRLLSELRRYVDSFGPGGLPVLKQENEALRAQVKELSASAQALRAESTALEARLRESEARWLELQLVQSLPSLETLKKREAALSERERGISEAELLQHQVERLRQVSQEQLIELDKWKARGLAEEQRREENEALGRLRREADEADLARQRADEARASAEARAQALQKKVKEYERRLEDLKLEEAAREERAQHLAALEEHNAALTRQQLVVDSDRKKLSEQLLNLKQELFSAKQGLVQQQEREQGLALQWQKDHADHFRKEYESLVERARATAEQRVEAEGHKTRAQLEDANRKIRELEERLRLQDSEHSRLVSVEQLAGSLQEQLVRERQEALNAQGHLRDQLREELESRSRQLSAEAEHRRDVAVKEAHRLSEELQRLQAENSRATALVAELAGRKGTLEQEVEHLQQKHAHLAQRVIPEEERLVPLRAPVFQVDRLSPVESGRTEEHEWLQGIIQGVAKAGFTFHPRLIYAFHTSLKVSQASPLTVLSGVSGTGKSELPRLYADLGGISFLPLSVQPSWDSPNDLFGFFDFTQGIFRAEPLARLLHQMTTESMENALTLVLLDEMNLARVEYYFADLLSKLEARRSTRDDAEGRERASITLDLGSDGTGVLRKALYLDPRVLFVGTMNEDESTLTLSDKVLDRACVLSFPSPRDMTLTQQQPAVPRAERLNAATWIRWQSKPTSEVAEKLNGINLIMDRLGRPFGHRLFRAISSYISNYPTAPGRDQASPDDAYTDQWVMKILPRLKGLECEDRQTAEGLNELRNHVPAALQEAFERSRSREYFSFTGAPALYRVGE